MRATLGSLSAVVLLTAASDRLRAAEGQARETTWKNVEASTVEVRRKMVKKYGIEF